MHIRKIILLTNRVPIALNDGGALAMEAMLKGYQQAGWSVHLLCMNTLRHWADAQEIQQHYSHLAQCKIVPFDNRLKINKVLKNYFFSSLPEHAERFYSKAFEAILKAMIQEVKPDVVQLESVFLGSYLPVIRACSEAKIFIRLHNIEAQIWQRLADSETNSFKKIYLNTLAKRIAQYEFDKWKEADLLLPITAADAQVVHDSGCTTYTQIIPFTWEFQTLPTTPFSLKGYHLAAMDWEPNKDAMLWMKEAIFPIIKKKVPEFEFFMAGKNMPTTLFTHLPVGMHNVGVLVDVQSFLSDKSILLVPLRAGSGVRIKIIEAMAKGKIVIATQIAIQGINAIENVHYLLANTPAGFADKIAWLKQNDADAKKMIIAAYQFAQSEYDQQNLPALLNKLIE